jgi:molybdopterin molybdotransferase
MALMPVADALARILSHAKVTAAETVTLDHAHGRVLAKPVVARRDQPPFHSSAMDGYAVRHADIVEVPAQLALAGVSAAGHGYTKPLKPGQAIRILTGAPVPRGADTVVIQENTTIKGNGIIVNEATDAGKNIRIKGLDFAAGVTLLAPGTLLTARAIALAAAANAAKVSVHAAPKLTLFTTGDELVLPGAKPKADQIFSSNSFAVAAAAKNWGAEVRNLGIIPDRPRAIAAAIRKGLEGHVLVTTGGASVGDHDYVQDTLRDCGVTIDFWKVALRPGKPLMFGHKGKTLVLGLPGNPVSALVCARLFLRPLLRTMQGLVAEERPTLARLGVAMAANDQRQDYVRAKLTQHSDGQWWAMPFAKQDSSMQRLLAEADGLIIREPFSPAAVKGQEIPIMKFED